MCWLGLGVVCGCGSPGMSGWGGVYHSHWVVHSHVVTKTLGVPSMAVSGAKKSRLKRNDIPFVQEPSCLVTGNKNVEMETKGGRDFY